MERILSELCCCYLSKPENTTQGHISEFCTAQNISWKFIPEHTPHFGGLWEAAVKSMKSHLKRVISETKLTFDDHTY